MCRFCRCCNYNDFVLDLCICSQLLSCSVCELFICISSGKVRAQFHTNITEDSKTSAEEQQQHSNKQHTDTNNIAKPVLSLGLVQDTKAHTRGTSHKYIKQTSKQSTPVQHPTSINAQKQRNSGSSQGNKSTSKASTVAQATLCTINRAISL